jgi:hypothetical protein
VGIRGIPNDDKSTYRNLAEGAREFDFPRDLFASGATILKHSPTRRGDSAASPVVFTAPPLDGGIVFGIDGRM